MVGCLSSARRSNTPLLSAAETATPASAQTNSALKARCDQLINYYERYGASRGENSDGARTMADIGARLDCEKGRYEQGVAAMEDLLRRKHFDVPPATQSAEH